MIDTKGIKLIMEGLGKIMNFEETARYLTRWKSTLYKMAKEEKISVVRIELGHSFTKYLLERRIVRMYIQELLGHKSSKTTEIYSHISKENLLAKIESPLDKIMKEEEI